MHYNNCLDLGVGDKVKKKEQKHNRNADIRFLQILSASVHNTPFFEVPLTESQWITMFEFARSHNVVPIVFEKACESRNFTEMPDYTRLSMETMAIVAGQARRTEAFLSLYSQLIKENIHPIVMKGIICRHLYGEYCDHRPSGDEDILIHKEEYKQVEKIFVENGYIPEQINIPHTLLEKVQEITFHNVQNGLTLEVHLSLMGNGNSLQTKINSFFKDAFGVVS